MNESPASSAELRSSKRGSPGFATMSVAAILAETAARMPDNIAVIVGDQQISYTELWDQTRQYAGALKARGVGEGTPVAMLIPNVADFPRVYFAVLALGGICVPIHSLLKADEVEYVLRDSGTQLLVCAAPLLGEGAKGAAQAGVDIVSVLLPAASAQPDPATSAAQIGRLEDEAAAAEPISDYLPRDPSDTATILYTSGTTGQPKGAEGCHLALIEQVNVLLLNTFDLRAEDRILGCLPLFHTFGQTCAMNVVFRAGATVVMVPKFDGDTALRDMNEQQITIFTGVPTMYMALLDAASRNPERPPLRYGCSGGSAIPVAVIDKFRDVFGAEIHEGYGLTETSPVATFNHVGRRPRAGTVGQPIWGVEVEVADPLVEDRIELLPLGELGEIVIRGHNLFTGYLNKPEETAKAMVDGWLRTGDLGTKDADAYVTIVDRTKDMILRNGYNVYPREVEEVLARHPAVAQVAVFGVADEKHGQEVMAVVILAGGAGGAEVDGGAESAVTAGRAAVTESELIDYAQEHMAAYKFPRRIEFIEALPIGPSGKVLKRELVAQYEGEGQQQSVQ